VSFASLAQRLWSRTRIAAPLALLAWSAAVAVGCAWWLIATAWDNRTIAALAAGRDLAVGLSSSPKVKFARAEFLFERGDFERAQPLLDSVVRSGNAVVAADALYDAANARLHQGIELIRNNKFDAATSQVILARDFYSRALRIDPQFWDAKYNLDIAMRLVRDFPDTIMRSDDRKKPTNKLWTDLPGLPKGGP
jgi:mxaK protein